jgi:hypothetical protein
MLQPGEDSEELSKEDKAPKLLNVNALKNTRFRV